MLKTAAFIAVTALALSPVVPGCALAQLGPVADAVALPSADLILVNGRIYTPTGWASSMAIAKGVIVAIGEEAQTRKAAGNASRTIDLKGQTVLPGLHDMHVHPLAAGTSELQCKIDPTSTLEQALGATADCVKGRKPGEWIIGRAYEPAALGATPTKAMLDKVAPLNPVVLTDVSIHSVWVNSAALKIAGITRATRDPQGGIIERDAKGEPTGILREAAAGLVRAHIPVQSRETNASALLWALDLMVSYGIVGLDDALVSTDSAQAYADLADGGKLKPYVRGCIISNDQNLIAIRQIYARDRFRPSCVKVLTDGVPTDAHTAAMLQDYLPTANDHGAETERSRGLLMMPPAQLARDLVRYDAMGLTVKLHAAGDAAVRESLDAIKAAREANGYSGVLHNVAHASFVAPEDFKRARDMGAVIEFSPYIWSPSPIVDGVAKAVGSDRMKRWIPIKEALDAGVFVVAGSDWNVVPSVNPWAAIETLVTRRLPGGAGASVGAAEAITLKQAVDIFTINAARLSATGDRSGSIETGKRADLVVIDRNIFEVPINTVHATKVAMTIIDGEIVFDGTKAAAPKP